MPKVQINYSQIFKKKEEGKAMVEYNVILSNVTKAKIFNEICQNFDFDIDAGNGHYIIDAKSILGLLSLDLSKPVVIKPASELDSDTADKFERAISEYIND